MEISRVEHIEGFLKLGVDFDGEENGFWSFNYYGQKILMKKHLPIERVWELNADVLLPLLKSDLLIAGIDRSSKGYACDSGMRVLSQMALPDCFMKQADHKKNVENIKYPSSQLNICIIPQNSISFSHDIHKMIVTHKATALPVLVGARQFIVGPFIDPPNQRVCLQCVRQRLQSALPKLKDFPLELMDQHCGEVVSRWSLLFWQRLESFLAIEIKKLKNSIFLERLKRGAFTVDLYSHEMKYEPIYPVADCSYCLHRYRTCDEETSVLFL